MEILAIIPARGGSKGIKRKNVKLLKGKPLVAYSIEAGLSSKYVTRTVVSTEDSEIKEVSLNFGAEVVDRPNELAQDKTKTAPVSPEGSRSCSLCRSNYRARSRLVPRIVLRLHPPLRSTRYAWCAVAE